MPVWIRRSLYGVMLISCAIIGMRFYLELNADKARPDAIETGSVAENAYPDKLPQFTLNDQWGEPRDISEWSGKSLLINFWATWCAPCRREMPLFEALHKSRADIEILGIAIDRPDDVQTFMAEAGITYPTLVGEQDAIEVSDQFGLEGLGLPFTVAVSNNGDILAVYIGEIDAGELDKMANITVDVATGLADVETARTQLEDL